MKYRIRMDMLCCVYTHSHYGVVFYVGQGSPWRPFEHRARNQVWQSHVAALEGYDIDIVLWTNDHREARRIEATLIEALLPVCNTGTPPALVPTLQDIPKVYSPQRDKVPDLMPAQRKNPYNFSTRRGNGATYVYRSVRFFPDFFAHIELIAGRERVSVNSLVNALLDLALETDQTEEGREAIHAACQGWRTRDEIKHTARRMARAAADAPPEE